jgi:hypothetical protein
MKCFNFNNGYLTVDFLLRFMYTSLQQSHATMKYKRSKAKRMIIFNNEQLILIHVTVYVIQ